MARKFNEKKINRDEVGKFATKNLNDAPGGLSALGAPAAQKTSALDVSARAQELLTNGYVPAASFTTSTSAKKATQWWDTAALLSEHSSAGDVAVMNDQAIGGTRTTLRRYSGQDTSLRMPSVAAVKRFAASSGAQSFDVPVSMETKDGAVTGWVRVSNTGNGIVAQGLNLPDALNDQVAESVASLIESRRPTQALSKIGDIAAAHAKRQARVGVDLTPAADKAIEIGFDPSSSKVIIRRGNRITSHEGSAKDAQDLRDAKDTKTALRDFSASNPSGPASKCRICGRFTSLKSVHTCPPKAHKPVSKRAAARLARNLEYSRTRAMRVAAMAPRIAPQTSEAPKTPSGGAKPSVTPVATPVAKSAPAPVETPYEHPMDVAEYFDTISTYVAQEFHRRTRKGLRAGTELDDLVGEAVLLMEERLARGGNVIENPKVYIRRLAVNICNPNRHLTSADRAAGKKLTELRALMESELGRELTNNEIEEIGGRIRQEWTGSTRRPSAQFWRETKVYATDFSSPDTIATYSGFVTVTDAYAEDEKNPHYEALHLAAERIEAAERQETESLGRAKRFEMRREVWDQMAAAVGAPKVVADLSAREVSSARTVISSLSTHEDRTERIQEGVRAAIIRHEEGIEDESTAALFMPFGKDLHIDEKDAITDLMRRHQSYAGNIWTSAVSSAQKERMAA